MKRRLGLSASRPALRQDREEWGNPDFVRTEKSGSLGTRLCGDYESDLSRVVA
jgi:hypothetical protein